VPAGSANNALEDLRAQIAELEEEIVKIERERAELRAHNRPTEERAMVAIRVGDDRTAKAALDALQASAEVDTLFEADLTVLRALAGECRDFLATVDQEAPGAPSDPTHRPPNDR
jgi:phage shock protein A